MDRSKEEEMEQGAGDQGLMFGYACDETPQLMPMPIFTRIASLSNKQRCGKMVRSLAATGCQIQVSVRYRDGVPQHIETVVISTQHDPDVTYADLREGVIEEIIKPVLPATMLSDHIQYLVNPTGRFVVGGQWETAA